MQKSKKYVPDLKRFMALCAKNYAKVLALLPSDFTEQETFEKWSLQIDKQPDLEISLLQQSRYTQTLLFSQSAKESHFQRQYTVRLYHDAQLAEVLSGLNDKMLPPVFPVPNSQMKQVDEKLQLNLFLSEWLSFCVQFGQIKDLPSAYQLKQAS